MSGIHKREGSSASQKEDACFKSFYSGLCFTAKKKKVHLIIEQLLTTCFARFYFHSILNRGCHGRPVQSVLPPERGTTLLQYCCTAVDQKCSTTSYALPVMFSGQFRQASSYMPVTAKDTTQNLCALNSRGRKSSVLNAHARMLSPLQPTRDESN